LTLFKRNIIRLQTIERFLRGGDATFRQITLTTSSLSSSSSINAFDLVFLLVYLQFCGNLIWFYIS